MSVHLSSYVVGVALPLHEHAPSYTYVSSTTAKLPLKVYVSSCKAKLRQYSGSSGCGHALGPSILSFVDQEIVLFQRLFCTEFVYNGTFGLSFV